MDERKESPHRERSQDPSTRSWVAKSDAYTRRYLEAEARFEPERYGRCGWEGVDEEVTRFYPETAGQKLEALDAAASEVGRLLSEETDPNVAFDLEILVEVAERDRERLRLESELLLPYPDVLGTVFSGVFTLLASGDEKRAETARVRLERYRFLPRQARDLVRSRLAEPGLLGPFRDAVEWDLATSERYLAGIEGLFEKSPVRGWEKPLEALREGFGEYLAFVRAEVLPRARGDFRLPREIYAANLRQLGVELSPAELSRWARVEFDRTQSEIREVSLELTGERDFRGVIRDLKKDQLTGEEMLAHYRRRIGALERLAEREGLLRLPDLEVRVHVASEVESVASPFPHVRVPPLLGAVSAPIDFVVPLRRPGAGAGVAFDEATCRAAADSLAAHEVLGHGVQFAAALERGLSLARRFCAFNFANLEGWAAYVEDEVSGYLPLSARVFSLQRRLLRAGRAFLEAELQEGRTSLSEASRILREEMGLSAATAAQEIQRYTFRRPPGEASTYFCGSAQLFELRSRARQLAGSRFERGEFHDFVLGEGFLGFKALRRRLEEAWPGTRARHILAPRP